MRFTSYIALCFVFSFTCVASASDIYRYTDDRGVEQFVDRLSAVPEQYRDQLNIAAKDLPDTPTPDMTKNARLLKKKKIQRQKKVEIFITEWCPHCQRLQKFLDSRKIKYDVYDIERSEIGKVLFQKLNGTGIPLTRVGNSQIIRGYNPKAILRALTN